MKAYWSELPTTAFEDRVLVDHVAVLPLGATEQHGPHLPVSTDTSIADGLMTATFAQLPDTAKVLVLPTLPVTNSTEHTNRPGTLSLGRDLAFKLILELAENVRRAGLKKLVIINAHGGNVGVMVDASHAIRAQFGLFCVATNWMRLGLPEGVVSHDDRPFDIHAGLLETSIMLALEPALVDMHEADRFPSLQEKLGEDFALLRAYGPIGFGWMGSDLNASGAQGEASRATVGNGEAIIAYQARRMALLLDEVARFQPDWMD
ncbi:MAG: creatininase family protein [Pseudomonadota bacterium]